MAYRDEPLAREPRTRIARGTGPATTLTPREARENQRALETVEKALGGRDALLDTLAVAAEAPEVEEVVQLLLDPRYARCSLRQICVMAGLTVVDLFAAYKQAMVVQAHLVAYRAITTKVLPVVEDVMRRAAPFKVPCTRCGGTGRGTDPDKPDAPPESCPSCAGHGELLQLPDLDRQKLALELAQLVQKSGGVLLQQNNLTVQPAEKAGGTLVGLQQAVRELLGGTRTPLAPIPATTPEEDPPIEGELAEADASLVPLVPLVSTVGDASEA